MARTPLFRSIRKLVAEHRAADVSGLPLEEVRERARRRRVSRRAFLSAGGAAVAAGLAPWKTLRAASQPRMAIVGGGISGLTAARILADRGVGCTIYEAENRTGGRMLSDRPGKPACGACHQVNRIAPDTWAEGQVTDVFGELIDSNHKTMLSLAKRFRLPLTDALAAEPAGSTETYYFNRSRYPKAQADADFKILYPALHADLQAAGYPTTFNSSTPAGRALDNLSLYDWIESRVPGGRQSPLGALLDVAYNIEYGAETADQSSLNLLYLLGYAQRSSFSAFGPSDERYRIAGGVDLLPRALTDSFDPSLTKINLGWELKALARRADGTYQLSFGGSRTTTQAADMVLLALPFATLRLLDYRGAGFDATKAMAIRDLGRGHNGKLHLQFSERLWNRPGGAGNGSSYADTGYQCTWDPTRGQAGASGILVGYTGGAVADDMRLRHPYGNAGDPDVISEALRFLSQVEPVFPGLGAKWNGRAAGSMAHLNPFWNSSYSYWRVGQCQTIAGYERVRQGNVFFAGEHTSLDFQGFMEGAASEGVRAANEMLAQLGRP
jgi:monoamine oxidase